MTAGGAHWRCNPGAPCRGWLVALLLLALLGGCGHGQEWRLTNLTGLMNPLAFRLTNAATGQVQTAADYAGEVVLLYFGYSHCPDVCPLTLANLAAAVEGLGDVASRVRILFVTVDPRRDTPEVLRAYAEAFSPRMVSLYGDAETLREVTKRYRVTFGYDAPDESGNYAVSHSSAVFIFDQTGKLRLLARDSSSVADIQHDLQQLLEEAGD